MCECVIEVVSWWPRSATARVLTFTGHTTLLLTISTYIQYIYEIYVSNIVLFYFYFFFFARHNFAYINAPANSNKQTNAIQMRPVLWLQYDICCGFYRNKFRSPIDNFNRPSSLNIEHTTNIDITFFYVFLVFYSTLLRTCTALSTHTTHHSKYTPYTYFVFSSSYSFVLCIFCVCLLSTIYFFHCMFVHWNHEFVGSGRPSFTRSHINSCLSMVLWHSSVVIRCVKSNLLLLRFKLAAHTQY